ncbi:hypothetical protein HPB48_008506 [Haemaphysalis longicornis]|uniref:Potassium channel domain-containing protein n=1 Tax=Haemaphysalis longicornis TaxID=44386 RepID=A0A9J6GJJ1_HAELO|nr:hypothetical protein HPB48_008506 [Haemaphysalis longicornis]
MRGGRKKQLWCRGVSSRALNQRLASLNLTELNSTDIKSIVARLADARSKNLMDEHGEDTHTNWNFYNSFFFAITVVTTIGYGHLAPSTAWGRVFCVLYAVVGVPMTGILLAGIGDHFARGMVRGLKRARGHRAPRLAIAANLCTFLLPWLLVFLLLPAAVFMFTEDWSYLEGLYYCFITLATIGFGDYVAGEQLLPLSPLWLPSAHPCARLCSRSYANRIYPPFRLIIERSTDTTLERLRLQREAGIGNENVPTVESGNR